MSTQAQVALVVRTENSIGTENAKNLARQGVNLALHFYSSYSRDRASRLANELANINANIKVSLHYYDLEVAVAADRLVAEVLREHRRLDLVVNSIGKVMTKPSATSSEIDNGRLFAYAVFVDEQRRKYVDLYQTSLQQNGS